MTEVAATGRERRKAVMVKKTARSLDRLPVLAIILFYEWKYDGLRESRLLEAC